MRSNYESAIVTEIGRAQDLILGGKVPDVIFESDVDRNMMWPTDEDE